MVAYETLILGDESVEVLLMKISNRSPSGWIWKLLVAGTKEVITFHIVASNTGLNSPFKEDNGTYYPLTSIFVFLREPCHDLPWMFTISTNCQCNFMKGI